MARCRPRLARVLATFLILSSAFGCYREPSANDKRSSVLSRGEGEQTPDAGNTAAVDAGNTATVDAGNTATVDAGNTAAVDAAAPPTPGAKHSACSTPLPAPLPTLPSVTQTATGRPKFDLWRDLDCKALNPCKGDGCTIYGDADIWCDGEGEVYSFRAGECWICAPAKAHASACCKGEAGVDCRAWPYPANGKPGTPCARHQDCEPGLVCGSHRGAGYGICMCPEANGGDVSPDDSCFDEL